MRKTLLFSAFTLSAIYAGAQTITPSDFGSIGDAFYLAIDTNINVNLGSTGAGQSWDFSSFTNDDVDSVKFVDPATTPDGPSFPSANLALHAFGNYQYVNKSATGVEIIAVTGNLQGFSGQLKSNPPQKFLEFTSSLGTNFTSNSNIRSSAAPLGFSLPCLISTVTIDSARIHRQSDLSVNCDASGTLSIPTGVYSNVLRVNKMEKTTDSVFIYADQACLVLGIQQGWQMAPALLVQQAGFPGNPILDTLYTYEWYAAGEKYPVTTILLDDTGNPGSAYYNYYSPLSVENADAQSPVLIYPNPATQALYVKYEKIEGKSYTITDLQGRAALQGNFNATGYINVEALPKGSYILSITDKGQVLKTTRFTVH